MADCSSLTLSYPGFTVTISCRSFPKRSTSNHCKKRLRWSSSVIKTCSSALARNRTKQTALLTRLIVEITSSHILTARAVYSTLVWHLLASRALTRKINSNRNNNNSNNHNNNKLYNNCLPRSKTFPHYSNCNSNKAKKKLWWRLRQWI